MKELKELLTELVAIDSQNPPGKCAAIARYVGHFIESHTSAAVHYQPVDQDNMNIIAVFGTPNALLNVHLDTVPASQNWTGSPFELYEDESNYYGLGATDVKGALSAILRSLQHVQPKDLLLLFNSDEENGNNEGVKVFLNSPFVHNLKYGIVTEPTQLNVARQHNGICNFEITVAGKQAHACMPQYGVNAIERAAGIIQKLLNYKTELNKRSDDGLKPSLNIAVIHGGTKSNVVPDSCIIKISRRYMPSETPEQVMSELHTLLESDEASITLTYHAKPLNVASYENKSIEILHKCGARNNYCSVSYWSEAALFADANIPAVVFGPGTINNAHCSNESIDKKELKNAIEIYKSLFAST